LIFNFSEITRFCFLALIFNIFNTMTTREGTKPPIFSQAHLMLALQ
jgi:hypothetical protein